ncbi:hypothetical protein AAKU52_003023 [Pedobacter sp. CG_S7]|uniref:DUF4783 domain-containing protein n=1 Tax=Pedobacter sp. CG_S7 TaxID=3143930 RepID=UPI00339B4750
MMRILYPLLILIAPLMPHGLFQVDFIDEMSGLFKSGDSKEIAQNFSASVELSIIKDEDVYSKVQAEQILREFFNQHNPKNSVVLHLINTNPAMRFGILSLATKNGNFRVSITSKKINNAFLITELRIDLEK